MSRDEREAGRADEIEALRILRECRRLVLLGRVRLPLAEARRLVGPDCAFHLYFRHAEASHSPRGEDAPPRKREGAKPGTRRRRRRRQARSK